MEVNSQLTLSESDSTELSQIIGCDPSELAARLAPYATAALAEIVAMFLGQKVFTRGSDILEYRLLTLIEHPFKGKIPSEQEVCKLFQMTASASRSLIRAVMSKYQYQLKTAIDQTLKQLIESADVGDDGCLTVAVHNLNLVEELNRELAEIDTSLPSVKKKRGSVSTYELQPSSYSRLCERFEVASKLPVAP